MENKEFITYLLSVLESQYVTSYEDLNPEGDYEIYVSVDIPAKEYDTIIERLKMLIA